MTRYVAACLMVSITFAYSALVHAAQNVVLHGKELWRAGTEDDEVLFGAVAGVLVDTDRTIYVLDSQFCVVRLFDEDGRHIRDLGREGDGPGEFRHPAGICFLDPGVLGVVQVMPGKLVGLNIADGTPAKDLLLSGSTELVVLVKALRGGDTLVLGTMAISSNPAKQNLIIDNRLQKYEPQGVPGQIYHQRRFEWRIGTDDTCSDADFDFPWQRVSVSRDGRVAMAASRDDYVITLLAADGSPAGRIKRDIAPWRRNERAQTMAEVSVRQQAQILPGLRRAKTEDTAPMINEILWRNNGTIWVQTTAEVYERKSGIFTIFDVFDDCGEHLGRHHVNLPGDPLSDLLVLDHHGRAIVVYGYLRGMLANAGIKDGSELDEAAAPVHIACFELQEK